ncbi:MAG: hypothetical protein BRC35_10355 [Cyanobacteria bacterium QH_10_48_56]|jgi:hypothetical protein|nr:MAG: hypothetical protein BRC35_10355 [Cyanobacteria bacterium QH_10_48_56]
MSEEKEAIAYLVSTLAQLEKRIDKVDNHTVRVKHELDGLSEAFNTRPELSHLEALQAEMAKLSEAVISWQQLEILQPMASSENPALTNAVVLDNNEDSAKEEIDAFADESQASAISAENFLERFNEGQRDFTEINLPKSISLKT